jgi:single-strand DNA-binding protein
MSRSINKVTLIGNVGKNPDVKYTQSGTPYTTFSLATSEVWKDKDGSLQERTDWHSVVAWRKLAEIIGEKVRKGSRLYIEGKIQTRAIEKNGDRRYVTDIVAENMLILDGKVMSTRGDDTYNDDVIDHPADDDIPF